MNWQKASTFTSLFDTKDHGATLTQSLFWHQTLSLFIRFIQRPFQIRVNVQVKVIFLWTGWGRYITLCNSGYLCLSYPSWNYVSFRITAVGPSTVGQKMLSLILKVGLTSLIFQIVLLFLGVLISTLLSYLVVNLSRGCVM